MKHRAAVGLFVSGISLVVTAQAQQCNENELNPTPTERFVIQETVVRDRVTGLSWQRCAVGQVWRDGTCAEALKPQVTSWFNWADAHRKVEQLQLVEGYAGWRLPTVQELRTLIDRHCQAPSINLEVFPNAPAWYFWTASEYTDNPDYAWQIDFKTGEISAHLKTSFSYYLRLVRGEQLATSKARVTLTPAQQRERALARWDDGIHDTGNPDLGTLQHPDEATAEFPRDGSNRVDWAKVLLDGNIAPRAVREGDGEMVVWDQDIILKDTASMPWVRFPHRLHSMWLACENCHEAIFPSTPGGGADISMESIYRGEHCGVCHGLVAFTPNACERCHTELHEGSPVKWW